MDTASLFAAALDVLLDPWVLFGFAAQAVFFGRFVVQLWASERAGKVVVPVLFWHLSILGAVMILAYAVHRRDIVFIVGQLMALGIYLRNLAIHLRRPASPVPN